MFTETEYMFFYDLFVIFKSSVMNYDKQKSVKVICVNADVKVKKLMYYVCNQNFGTFFFKSSLSN